MGPELDEVKKSWAQRGFSFAIWVDSPGQEWKDFVHPVDELVMLVEGEIELEFQGQTLRPPIAEEILIPAGTAHTVRNVGSVTNRWYYGYKRKAKGESHKR